MASIRFSTQETNPHVFILTGFYGPNTTSSLNTRIERFWHDQGEKGGGGFGFFQLNYKKRYKRGIEM